MTLNSVSLFLLAEGVSLPVVIVIAVLAVALGIAGGIFVGSKILQKQREKKIGSAEAVVAKMKEDAEQECKQLKKEAILEAKEQDLKLRKEFESESKEKRLELQKMEQRLVQKDEILN